MDQFKYRTIPRHKMEMRFQQMSLKNKIIIDRKFKGLKH